MHNVKLKKSVSSANATLHREDKQVQYKKTPKTKDEI